MAATIQPTQLRVFVSHSHEDDAFCRQIVTALRNAGADVWYDEHNLGSGRLQDVILGELDTRPIFIVILSKHAIASKWVKRETDWAEELKDRDPSRVMLPVTAGPLERNDFGAANGWLAYYSYKRVEAPGFAPYPVADAAHRLLRALALTPAGESPAPVAPQPTESVDDLLTRGKALLAQKQYAEALPLFERASQRAPGLSDAWANLGFALGNLSRWQESLAADERALALDDKQAWVWSNKGIALRNLKRHQEALVAYDRALALDPNYAFAWYNKGAALNGLKRHAEALVAYDRALALDPNYAQPWNNKAMALLEMRRYDDAMAAVDRSLALNPEESTSWDTKGQILNALSRYQDALLCLDRAIKLNPNLAEAWHNKALALRALGRTTEAEAAEKRAKELGWTG